MKNFSRKIRVIWINNTKPYINVKINGPIMPNYNFNSSDILYMMPRDIMKYLTRSDFALIIAIEPHTLETMETLEILLMNFEQEEEYEWCSMIKKEIDFRVETYNKHKDGEEETPGKDLPIQG